MIQTFPKLDFPTRWGEGEGRWHESDMFPKFADFLFAVTPYLSFMTYLSLTVQSKVLTYLKQVQKQGNEQNLIIK